MDGEVPAWRYPEASVFRKMAEDFPETGAAARNRPMPDAGEVRAWLEANAPGLYDAEFDLLYKSRYDFQVYAKFPPLPADPCGLFNADRFLFSFMPPPVPGNLTQYLEKIGERTLIDSRCAIISEEHMARDKTISSLPEVPPV